MDLSLPPLDGACLSMCKHAHTLLVSLYVVWVFSRWVGGGVGQVLWMRFVIPLPLPGPTHPQTHPRIGGGGTRPSAREPRRPHSGTMGTTNRAKEASQEAQEDVGRRKEEARDVEDHVKRGNRRGGKALSAVLAGGSAYLSLRAVNHWWLVLRRKLLRDIFLTVVPVLNETKVDYWADFGTLLGMHREGDLILHDNDVDVVLLDPDWKEIIPALEKTLESRGYQLKVTETVDKETGKLYTWVRVWGLCGAFADLYAANLCQDGDMIKLYNEGLKIPKRLIFPRRSMRFRGTEVSVPGRIEDVLEYRYGEDYMVPKYMEKGRDEEENNMKYAKILRAVGKLGFRFY